MRLDADTLTDLYRYEGPRLLAFATRRTFDPDAALDVVGETFAIAFERRSRFRGDTRDEAVAWLFAICRSLLLRRHRRAGIELRGLERLGVEPPVMGEDERRRVEDLAGLDALRLAVRDELHRLPPGQRDAVQLRIVDELDYEDVAQRLGVSQDSARARVSRGLRAMTQALAVFEEVPDA